MSTWPFLRAFFCHKRWNWRGVQCLLVPEYVPWPILFRVAIQQSSCLFFPLSLTSLLPCPERCGQEMWVHVSGEGEVHPSVHVDEVLHVCWVSSQWCVSVGAVESDNQSAINDLRLSHLPLNSCSKAGERRRWVCVRFATFKLWR